MANTLLTPALIARETMKRVFNNAATPALVHRDFEADFRGKQGDTITVRKPAAFSVNEFDRTAGITVQDATESGVDVKLDTLLDVSFAVTTEQLTLEIEDFGDQFLGGVAEGFQQKFDKMLIAEFAAGVTQTVGVNGTTPTDLEILIDAGKILNDNAVPVADRHTLLTTAAAAEFKRDARVSNASAAGSTEGLREASLGRVFGFDNYEDQNLTGGDGYAFHRSAIALVTRTLVAPNGVAPSQVAVINYKGFGLRVVQAYDINVKQDVISIDCLAGVKLLDATRAVKILG